MSPVGSSPGDAVPKVVVGLPTQKTVPDPALVQSTAENSPADLPQPPGEGEFDAIPTAGVSTRSLYLVENADAPYDQGAMGTIVLARDETLGRTVALKILREKHVNNAGLRERFRREAAITGQLQHPGVPPVFSLGSLADSRPFFSMRLVEGRPLAQLLEECQDRAQEQPRFLTIFEQICQAVAFAHTRGIIHRDLKPSNVVVGEYGSVYVMDWGIARVLSHPPGNAADLAAGGAASHLSTKETISVQTIADRENDPKETPVTIAGEFLGTPQYMSPEQAAGDPRQDERTDVFSLGAILFEILTGEPLRPVTTVGCRELVPYTRAYVQTVQAALETVRADAAIVNLARRCLEVEPEGRPRTAVVVAAEVTAYLLYVLQRPEREMARFFELSLDLFCLAGLDGYFKQINQNFTRVLGYSSEELLSAPFMEYVHPDDREQTRLQVERLSQGLPVVQFENRYRDRWGKYKWFEWTAKSVPQEGIIFAVAREVTARKHLEERLKATVESSPVAMVISDEQGLITQLNREAERLFGYASNELLGRPVEILIPERFRDGHHALRQGFLANPVVRYGSGRELYALRKDGAEMTIELGLSPLQTEEGIFVISVISDVTESRRQERWFKALAEKFPAALVFIDRSDVIRIVNRETERLFGYAREELIGRPVDLLFPDEFPNGMARPTGEMLTRLLAHGDGDGREIKGKHRDGAEIVMEARIDSLETGERVLAVSPILDSSARSRT